jgi:hypothetical protein
MHKKKSAGVSFGVMDNLLSRLEVFFGAFTPVGLQFIAFAGI